MFYYNFLIVLIMIVGMLKGINFNSGLNVYGTIVFSDPIPYKGANIVAIWQHNKRVFGIFSLRLHGNGYFGAYVQKSDHAIRSGDVDFL